MQALGVKQPTFIGQLIPLLFDLAQVSPSPMSVGMGSGHELMDLE